MIAMALGVQVSKKSYINEVLAPTISRAALVLRQEPSSTISTILAAAPPVVAPPPHTAKKKKIIIKRAKTLLQQADPSLQHFSTTKPSPHIFFLTLLPLLPSAAPLRYPPPQPGSPSTLIMADEVYDGAIGIDLGKDNPELTALGGHDPRLSTPPCISLTNVHFSQVPLTLVSLRTRAPMSRSSPTSRVASLPRLSSPSPTRSD